MLACLSRRSFISDSERASLLFLNPANPESLPKQMQEFELAVQQTIWNQNLLQVKFVIGSPQDKKDRVKTIVENNINKTNFMNLKFQFVAKDEYAHIRISFFPNQHSWSAIGNEALFISEDFPTMNLSDLSQGNILHQFAHAFGMPHVHKYVTNGVNWNKPIVDKVFAGLPHEWKTQEAMEKNFYSIYNLNQFYNYRNYDKDSLMLNIWPCEFFLKPPTEICDIKLKNNYSIEDKQFFESLAFLFKFYL